MNFETLQISKQVAAEMLSTANPNHPVHVIKIDGHAQSAVAILVPGIDEVTNQKHRVLQHINQQLEQLLDQQPDWHRSKYNAAQLFEQQLMGWDAGNQSASVIDLVDSAGLTLAEWNWLQESGEVEWLGEDLDSEISEHLMAKDRESQNAN